MIYDKYLKKFKEFIMHPKQRLEVEKKDGIVTIRLGKKERAMAQRQAEKLGLTLSAYIRMLIYEKENAEIMNVKR